MLTMQSTCTRTTCSHEALLQRKTWTLTPFAVSLVLDRTDADRQLQLTALARCCQSVVLLLVGSCCSKTCALLCMQQQSLLCLVGWMCCCPATMPLVSMLMDIVKVACNSCSCISCTSSTGACGGRPCCRQPAPLPAQAGWALSGFQPQEQSRHWLVALGDCCPQPTNTRLASHSRLSSCGGI